MGLGHYYIYCNGTNYAVVYPGASLMALNVVLPELLLPPPMVIVILPLKGVASSKVEEDRLALCGDALTYCCNVVPSGKVPYLLPIMIKLEWSKVCH